MFSATLKKLLTGIMKSQKEEPTRTCEPSWMTTRTDASSSSSDSDDAFAAPEYSPSKAKSVFARRLSSFEKEEINEHPAVYFVSGKSFKNHKSSSKKEPEFRDSNGYYPIVKYDHIAYRYEIMEELGRGAFGVVVKAYDHKTDAMVALKIVGNGDVDEVRILSQLQSADPNGSHNLIRMLDAFSFRGHLCIVFELMGLSLHDLLEQTPPSKGFSDSQVRDIADSVLDCVGFLHRNQITHCDLKPDNILFDPARRSLRVIDLGLACVDGDTRYDYIQARPYRAPEVLLGLPYASPIDMWSLGCILAELATGTVLFHGEDTYDQMAAIVEILGLPPKPLLADAPHARHFFSSRGYPKYCRMIARRGDGSLVFFGGTRPSGSFRGPPRSKRLGLLLGAFCDKDFLHFLSRCLDWDPSTRLTADEALVHPWILKGRKSSTAAEKKERLKRRLPTPHPFFRDSIVEQNPSV